MTAATRCRLGMHHWARFRLSDPTVAARDQGWETRCKDCGKPQTAGTAISGVLFGVAFAAGIVCLLVGPPLLGAVIVVGAVGGLMWTAGMAFLERVVKWLSLGR